MRVGRLRSACAGCPAQVEYAVADSVERNGRLLLESGSRVVLARGLAIPVAPSAAIRRPWRPSIRPHAAFWAAVLVSVEDAAPLERDGLRYFRLVLGDDDRLEVCVHRLIRLRAERRLGLACVLRDENIAQRAHWWREHGGTFIVRVQVDWPLGGGLATRQLIGQRALLSHHLSAGELVARVENARVFLVERDLRALEWRGSALLALVEVVANLRENSVDHALFVAGSGRGGRRRVGVILRNLSVA